MGIDNFLSLFTEKFFNASIRMATPLILAAIGEVYLERAGILNLGLEAMMLLGAFFGVLGASLSGSPIIGLLSAIMAGLFAGLIFGIWVISLRANQIVTGAAMNIAALGLTSFLSRVIFGIRTLPTQVTGFKEWPIPILSDIPVIGRILFYHTPLVYFALFLVIIMTFILFRTTWGLKIRAIGEHPRASESVGIGVLSWRYGMSLLCGGLCGIAGATLSLAQLTTFVDNMTAGRGFIALAAVIFGRWNPIGASAASLVFGATDALQMRFQAFSVGLPPDIFLMLPYLLTLVGVIVFRSRRTQAPVALAKPYKREDAY